MNIETTKRNIAIAHRAQAEIEERNPDYIEGRGEDSRRWHELEMDLIELNAKMKENDEAMQCEAKSSVA